MKPPRVVLFDAVGTLIHPEPSVATAYFQVGRKFGSRWREEDLRTRFRAAFSNRDTEDAGDRQFRTDEEHERNRWRRIVAEVFDDLPHTEPLLAELWQHFALPEHWRLYPDAAEAIQALAQQTEITLGIASNFDRRLETVLAGFPELRQLSKVFISSQIGFRKPGPGFFQAIEKAIQCEPDDILLIGDDPINDIGGAQGAGWRSLQITRKPIDRQPGSIESLTRLRTMF